MLYYFFSNEKNCRADYKGQRYGIYSNGVGIKFYPRRDPRRMWLCGIAAVIGRVCWQLAKQLIIGNLFNRYRLVDRVNIENRKEMKERTTWKRLPMKQTSD